MKCIVTLLSIFAGAVSARLTSPSADEAFGRELLETKALFEEVEPRAGGCECESDYDCHPTCVRDPYSGNGFCQTVSNPSPTPKPTLSPTPNEPCPCDDPKNIPTKCEVEILIALMDLVVSGDLKRNAQWLRASFHDAGTFDQNVPEGGANGCLMTHPPMLLEPENAHLDVPVAALETIKNNWEAHPETCLKVSAADIIQFGGFFATVRQRGPVPGVLDATKVNQLLAFEWGRPDETNCDTAWTLNLPGFDAGAGQPIAQRCTASGGEIKDKMMDRNGFTVSESVALIGAHTIGHIRNTFGPGWADPWVTNGGDNGAAAVGMPLPANGPIFDNAYHDFLINAIVENDAVSFAGNVAPFDGIFPDWFTVSTMPVSHLDTDVTLAFDSLNPAVHPHFRPHSAVFAASNADFLSTFDKAMDKMSKLGVTAPLSFPTECLPCEGEEDSTNKEDVVGEVAVKLVVEMGQAMAFAEANHQEKNRKLENERKESTTPVDINRLDPIPELGTIDVKVEERKPSN